MIKHKPQLPKLFIEKSYNIKRIKYLNISKDE